MRISDNDGAPLGQVCGWNKSNQCSNLQRKNLVPAAADCIYLVFSLTTLFWTDCFEVTATPRAAMISGYHTAFCKHSSPSWCLSPRTKRIKCLQCPRWAADVTIVSLCLLIALSLSLWSFLLHLVTRKLYILYMLKYILYCFHKATYFAVFDKKRSLSFEQGQCLMGDNIYSCAVFLFPRCARIDF